MSNGCTNLSRSLYAYMHPHACVCTSARTHTRRFSGTGPAFNKQLVQLHEGDPTSVRLCCRADGNHCLNSLGRERLLHLLPRERKSLRRQARASTHRGWIVPVPKLCIVNYLLPALLMIRVTHQTGRWAAPPVVRLMNNWTGSLEAPINSKTSFTETSVQPIKTDDFWTWTIKNVSYTLCVTVYKSWFVPFQTFRISPKYAWLKSPQIALFRCERKNNLSCSLHSKFLVLSAHEMDCLWGDNVFFVPSKVCEECLPG